MMLCLLFKVTMHNMAPLAVEVFYKVERAVMYSPPMQRCHAVCGCKHCIVDKAAGRKDMSCYLWLHN